MKQTILIVALAGAAVAQTAPDAAPAFGQNMKENAAALRQYSHKRRTEIEIKGKSRVRVDLVRYVDGKAETVPLEAPERPERAGRGGGPLRGMMVQKKKEEMKEDVEQLNAFVHRYITPDADSLHGLLEKASISKTGDSPDAPLKVVAAGVVDPSDSLTLIWNVANRRPEKIEIRSKLKGKPVSATVEYAALPDGPFYAARTVIAEPKKDLKITIDTFDYTRQ